MIGCFVTHNSPWYDVGALMGALENFELTSVADPFFVDFLDQFPRIWQSIQCDN